MNKNEKPAATCDVAVIGAGPAGSMAAAVLKAAGLSVQVFEATRFPRFVIGESLLPRCMDLLADVDLLDVAAAQNYQRKIGAVFLWEDKRQEFNFTDQFSEGWSYTWQVPRAHFDNILATAVAERGVPIFFEHKVTSVKVGTAPELTVESAGGDVSRVSTRFIVDASGYGRVLPRLLDLHADSTQPMRQACFTHVKGDQRPPGIDGGRIWVISNSVDAWTWIIPFSNGITSVGCVGAPEYFEQFSGSPNEVLRAIIAASSFGRSRLSNAEFLFDAREIKNYAVGVKRLYGEGFCLVGNATEFLDPVFSSGVTLALESGNVGAKLVARQLHGEKVDWEREYSEHMRQGIDVFRTYVEGWYDGTLAKIFRADAPPTKFKQMICSVLAGYVWDKANPFVAQHQRKVQQLAQMLEA
jgi:flavin-dependent dehydrogenase